MSKQELEQVSEKPKSVLNEKGMYIYCVADSSKSISLGKIGIDNSMVYTIPYKDLCVVVHDCEAKPYKSDNDDVVKKWVRQHQDVIEIASEKLGTAIPLTFDMIVKGDNPMELVKKWLLDERENLKTTIGKIKGKQEFGIQISWGTEVIGKGITAKNEEIKKLKQEMEKASKGKAYFYEQKIKDLLKKEMEKMADSYFKKFYEEIKKHAEDIKIGKTKKPEQGRQMLMNVSCLTYKEKVKELGAELEKINNIEGFFVKFTGPWPPYSFVSYG